MERRKQTDWFPVVGEIVQIRNNGQLVQNGRVDAVTNDGAIFWLAAEGVQHRQLITKDEGYEVWRYQAREIAGA